MVVCQDDKVLAKREESRRNVSLSRTGCDKLTSRHLQRYR